MTSNSFKAQDILNFDPPFHLRDPNLEPGSFKVFLSKGTHTPTHNIQLFWVYKGIMTTKIWHGAKTGENKHNLNMQLATASP